MREANKLQGTGAWHNDRTGKLTGSRMDAAMAFLKPKKGEENKPPKEASERRKLKVEILCERLTGNIVNKYVTIDMQWGTDQEPMAKHMVSELNGWTIQDLGFVPHPTIENCGCSPDGYIREENALIEIKCPTSSTMVGWLIAAAEDPNWVPPDHIPQMLLQSSCFGGLPVWFVAYDPRLPEKQKLLIRKFVPTKEQLEEVENAARSFLEEVDYMFDKLTLGE